MSEAQKKETDLTNFRTGHGRGIKCPQCQSLIEINPVALAACAPVICGSCGLELTVDRTQSAEALKALQKLVTGVQKAETLYNSASKLGKR